MKRRELLIWNLSFRRRWKWWVEVGNFYMQARLSCCGWFVERRAVKVSRGRGPWAVI